MTLEEKYEITIKALRYYAVKEETLCDIDTEDPYSYSTCGEGANEVAICALTMIEEDIQDNGIVTYCLLDWKYKADIKQ